MITKNIKFAKNPDIKELDLFVFKNTFDFQQTIDDQIKNELQDLLLNDILTFFDSLQSQNQGNEEDNYDRAFQEMIRQQNIKLAGVNVMVEKKTHAFNGFLTEFKAKFQPTTQNKSFSPSRSHIQTEVQNKSISKLNFKTSENKIKSNLKNSKQNKTVPTDRGVGATPIQEIQKSKRQVDKRINIPDNEKDLYQKINSGKSNQTYESFRHVSPKSDAQHFNTQQDKSVFTAPTQQDYAFYLQQQEEQDVLLGHQQNLINNQNQRLNTYHPQTNQQHQNNFLQKNPSAENIHHQRSQSPSNPPHDRYYSPTSPDNIYRRVQQNQDTSVDNVSRGNKPLESIENSPNRTIPQPSTYEIRPNHQDECCRKLMKSARNTSQDFYGKPTPYKRRNKELEEIVFDLNKKLNNKEGEINQLKLLNVTIKDKLVEINSSNEANTKKSQIEQLELLRELEKNRELNRIYDQELKELRSDLNKLLIKNHELSDAEKSSIYYQQKQKEIQEQYDLLQDEVREKELADQFNQKRILRKGLLFLKFSSDTQKKINNFRYDKKKERNQYLIINCFHELKRYYYIKSLSRQQREESTLSLYKNFFMTWKRNVIFQDDVQRMIKKRQQEKLALGLVAWKQYINQKDRDQKEKIRVQNFRLKQLRIKSWRLLKQNYRKSVLTKKEFDQKNTKAIQFDNSKSKRKFFKLWKLYITNKMHRSWILNAYQKSQGINQQQYQGQQICIIQKEENTSQFSLGREKSSRHQIASLFIKKRLLKTWKQTFQISRNLKRLEEKAKQFSLKKLIQRHFNALKDLKELSKRRNLLAKAVKTRRENQTKRISMFKWFKLSISKKSERIDRINKQNELQRAYFKQWLMLVQQRVFKKQKLRQTLNLQDKKEKQTVSSVFSGWLFMIKRKIRNRGVVENMLSKKDMFLKRLSLYQFSKEQKLGLYKKILHLKNNQTLLNADFKENQIYLESIDEEKNEIVDKSRELMQQNIILQEHITEKNSEINALKRQVQMMEKQSYSQDEIIKDLSQKVGEQETHILEINNEYVVQMDQEETTQKNMRIDNKSLQREISQMQKELEQYEKQYQNRTSEILGNNRDLSEKFQHSIIMANEFKEKIQEQDKVIGDLELKIIELNDNNQKQKEHITECVSVIQQFETTYDSKVAEYENIINQLNLQIEENRVQQEESANYIENLQQEIKKLEYEVSLLTENHQASTTQFISNLYRSGQKPERMHTSGGYTSGQNLNHSISSEADAYTMRKRQGYFTSPTQTDQNYRSTTSKDYKILQKSFERQRTQMKDKIQSLTSQIQNTLNSQRYDELLPSQDNAKPIGSIHFGSAYNSKANQSQIILPSTKQSKSTATFFTERRQQNHDKSFEESQKFINLKNSGIYGKHLLKSNGERKESPNYSLRNTPKVQKHKTNSSSIGVIGLGLSGQANINMNQSQNTTYGIKSDVNAMISPSYNYSSNMFQPARPDSAKESRTMKSSVNDLSMINNTESILQELEKSKSGRKILKSQLELRIKDLNDNIEKDILNSKRININ